MISHVFLGFRNGKLVTVVLSVESEREKAVDCDYYVCDPQEAGKQVLEWLKERSE